MKTRIPRGHRSDRIAHEGRPIFADYRRLVGTTGPEAREGLHSIAILPLLADEQLVGCLNVASHRMNAISKESQEALRIVAGTTEQAISRLKVEAQLRRREAELSQSQRLEAIGRLAGGIAHDFNNILSSVLLNVEMLMSEASPRLSEELQEIAADAQRAAKLTEQLLSYSRRSALERRRIDLGPVVSEIHGMLRRLLGETYQLDVQVQKELPRVDADKGRVQQVLMNLVVNARDAMPDGGSILLSASTHLAVKPRSRREAEPWVVLAVEDQGDGMDEETARRAFEPFYTTKHEGRGTGLGLATVEGIAAQHGGWVALDTEPGRGSKFMVYLPVATGPERETKIPSRGGPRPPSAGRSILLVEDDARVRDRMTRVLKRLGHLVHEASNSVEALEVANALAENELDLIVTDMVIPGNLNGRALIDQIRGRWPGLPAVLMSGYSLDWVQDGAPGAHDVCVLHKPIRPDALDRAIRTAVAR